MKNWQKHGTAFLNHIDASGKKILDAGCGDGWASIALRERGASVTSMDIIPAESPLVSSLHGAGIPYVTSFDGLENYDLVWCHHVLEHMRNPISFLIKLHKVGEELWVAVPYANMKSFAKGHINNYTMPLLVEHLRLAGWAVKGGAYTTQPSKANLWAVVRRSDSIDNEYPAPMKVLNDNGVNGVGNMFFPEWNWDNGPGRRRV